MPVSRIKIFCYSLGFYLIALSCAKLEQCKSEQVEVDLEGHITIPYSLCADPNSVCFQRNNEFESCEPDEPSETITKAEIVDENGDSRALKVQDHKEFHVLLPEEGERFTDTGSFHYNISYEYEAECIPSWVGDCSGWVRDLRLSVTVVDYNLKLLPSSDMDNILVTSTTDELQIHSERNVSLLCSSGLSDKFSSLNIPVTFTFHSKHDSDYRNVSAPCDKNQDTVSVNNGDVKWIITREQSPPYDCVLTIVDFGEHNSGKYRCAGVLSQSDSVSSILHLKLQTELQTTLSVSQDLGSWATIFFGILVTFIAAIVLSLIAIVSYSAYRYYKRWRHGLFQNLPRFNGYGSTSTICQENDLSRPHTPNPNNNAEDHPFLQYTSGADTDTYVSEMESSVDRPCDRRSVNRHGRGNATSSVVESSDISSEDSHHATGYTDNELTDIALDGKTPRCRHCGPCDMSLICQYCDKAYCVSQSQFFTRHEKKCQQAINSTSDSEPGPHRANLVTVEFHLEPGSPSEVHRDTQSPTEAAAAVDGVDQGDLNFTRHKKKYQRTITSTSDSEPGPPNIPHISSELNLPAIFHQEPGSPSEVHRDTDQSPTEAAAAIDGVDQSDLNFMSESDRSNPPTSS